MYKKPMIIKLDFSKLFLLMQGCACSKHDDIAF